MLWLLHAATAGAATPPTITAEMAIVVHGADGRVFYEKNADQRGYPASMTKILTCIIGLEQGEPSEIVEVSASATQVESTRMRQGQELLFSDLLRQMMMISDNGAALAVGETLSGNQERFAALMNEKAAAIGVVGTHFVNPNGMPDPKHYSTARDMARIAAYAMKDARFRQIVGTDTKNIYYLKPGGLVQYCENTNELLETYPGCTGIKTGWTNAARGCLAASAKRGEDELIVILMRSQDDETRFREAAALLDYGFARLAEDA